ncbi:MAG: hypothetical protein V8S74_09025 [Lachnospirales bacterium]
MKRKLVSLAALSLVAVMTACSAVSADTATTTTTNQESQEKPDKNQAPHGTIAKVTAVNGNAITFVTAEMGKNGEKPDNNGEPPAKPEGSGEGTTNGKPPAKPEGSGEGTTNGQPPAKPEGNGEGTTNGKPPAKPEGSGEGTTNGKPPAKPEGSGEGTTMTEPPTNAEGQPQNGEKPEMTFGTETKTLTIDTSKLYAEDEKGGEKVAGSVSDIKEGTILDIQYDEDGTTVKSITIRK